MKINPSNFYTDDPEPEDDKMTFMQQNFGIEITQVMKDTVFSRRSLIRKRRGLGDKGISELMEIMPRLFDTEGMVRWTYERV